MDDDDKDGLERYLSELVEIPSGARKLRDLIEFNVKHRHLELPDGYDSQDRYGIRIILNCHLH